MRLNILDLVGVVFYNFVECVVFVCGYHSNFLHIHFSIGVRMFIEKVFAVRKIRLSILVLGIILDL